MWTREEGIYYWQTSTNKLVCLFVCLFVRTTRTTTSSSSRLCFSFLVYILAFNDPFLFLFLFLFLFFLSYFFFVLTFPLAFKTTLRDTCLCLIYIIRIDQFTDELDSYSLLFSHPMHWYAFFFLNCIIRLLPASCLHLVQFFISFFVSTNPK